MVWIAIVDDLLLPLLLQRPWQSFEVFLFDVPNRRGAVLVVHHLAAPVPTPKRSCLVLAKMRLPAGLLFKLFATLRHRAEVASFEVFGQSWNMA